MRPDRTLDSFTSLSFLYDSSDVDGELAILHDKPFLHAALMVSRPCTQFYS